MSKSSLYAHWIIIDDKIENIDYNHHPEKRFSIETELPKCHLVIPIHRKFTALFRLRFLNLTDPTISIVKDTTPISSLYQR